MVKFTISQFARDIIFIILLKIVAVIALYAIFFNNHTKPLITPNFVAEKIIK